jgi:hypothetical protein
MTTAPTPPRRRRQRAREGKCPQWPPRPQSRPWRAPIASTPTSAPCLRRLRTARFRRPSKRQRPHPRPHHPCSSGHRKTRRRNSWCTRCCTRTWACRRSSTASKPAFRVLGSVPLPALYAPSPTNTPRTHRTSPAFSSVAAPSRRSTPAASRS